MAKYSKEVPVRPSKNDSRGTQKDPVRLSKLRQTSQAAFAASSYSSWFVIKKIGFVPMRNKA